MNWFCMAVRTGAEDNFIARVRNFFEGRLVFFRKLMRTKKGKIYDEPFFPGYVFLETEDPEPWKSRPFSKDKDFYCFLPGKGREERLCGNDLNCIENLLQYGETLGFAPCLFDQNDRIVITAGPFKDIPGTIVAVNRRNHRVNVRLDLFNRALVVGLTYYDIKKEDWSKDEEQFLKQQSSAN